MKIIHFEHTMQNYVHGKKMRGYDTNHPLAVKLNYDEEWFIRGPRK